MMDHISRPLGSSFNCWRLNPPCTVTFWVSTRGVSPVTTTVCCCDDGVMVVLMVSVNPNVTFTC